MKQKDFRAF